MGVDGARLVGTWRLAAASSYDAAGAPAEPPFGTSPSGLLIYTGDGHMAALISHSGRRPLSVADRLTAPADERADAFATYFSYAGRYTVGADEIRHRIDVASIENWVGAEFVRAARLDGERLALRTPPMPVGDATRVIELIWERAGEKPSFFAIT